MTQDQQRRLPTGKLLHIDCFAGVAGDMFLGAMLDLGVPERVVREGLAALSLSEVQSGGAGGGSGQYELRIDRATRMGIVGRDVKVVVSTPAGATGAAVGSAPEKHAHSHHSWRGIRAMIESSALDDGVKRRAVRIFERVARVEGRLHGKPTDEVAFHEVGAVDSIVDIVGAAIALEALAPARVTSRPVPLGRGITRCAHGVLPVPSPAAVAILAEVEAAVEDGDAELELCTPTGAAIIADTVTEFGGIPTARIIAAGYGAGDAQLEDRPNLLRLMLFEPAPAQELDREAVVLEANIDNMPPEWCGYLMERLFAAGGRDVWFTPIQMKKGRPALMVSTLCASSDREAVGAVLLTESTTIGLRYHHVGRRVLARRLVEVETPYGPVRVKVALEGERALNAAPEYEDCRSAAERTGTPLKEVHAATLAAYRNLADLRGER